MADEPKKPRGVRGIFKAAGGAVLGLFSGAAVMYATAVFDTVVKPSKPVANFAVTADGLTVTCQSHATGDSGWWDFGDGTPLEPFDAAKPAVEHVYARPGNYAVKLIVRNFLMEENERSVPVSLTAAPNQLPPQIADLRVEPIGPRAVAPATFRIRGEVKNAQHVVMTLGDRYEVNTEGGPFERLVVFEKPGQYPIQVMGHSGKQAAGQITLVTVERPASGSVSAVLRVTDSGTKTDRQTFAESVPLPPPAKGAKAVEKTVAARPGYAIVQASIGKVTSPAVKKLKAEVAADKRSVKLTGEWAGDAAGKPADVIVPLVLVEEKATPVALPPQMMAGALAGGQPVSWKLPPQPIGLAGFQRKMELEFREAMPDGKYRVLHREADLKLPYSGVVNAVDPVRGTLSPHRVAAAQTGETVQVTWQ
jgi:PKD repeat protein